jgi:hypothetical protein
MSFLGAWVAFWDRREAPSALALVRILVGAALFFDLVVAAAGGLVEAVWAPPPHGIGYGALAADPPLAVRWLGASPDTAWTLWAIALVCIALVTLGAATRVAGAVFVVVSAQLAHLAPDSDRGIDILLRVVVGILVLSRANACWSVDAWVLRRFFRRAPPAQVPAWPRYLMFAQLVWMYFSAGTAKGDPAWGPKRGFSALAMILTDPHFARWDAGWIASIYPLTQLATASTMLFELGAPVYLVAALLAQWERTPPRVARVARVIRWAWLALGFSFHLGIAVFMRLGVFPFGMLAVWPAFVRPDEWAALWAWLRRRRAQARPST